MSRPKNPQRPPRPLTVADGDVIEVRPVLWRIHRVGGEHRVSWRTFRTFGPLHLARFDPHPLPCGAHPGYGVSYAALDVATCVAEVFQHTRTVRTDAAVHLTGWTPNRPLRLLDLSKDWALRNGASHSLYAAPRRTCRAWSHAIRETWPQLDGLWAPSTLTGRPIVVLYQHAQDSLPAHPQFSRPLSNSLVWLIVADVAERAGYRLG